MNWTNQLIFTFCVSLASSIVMTKIVTSILTHFAIVDVPDSRRAHQKITPRGGGITLVIIFVLNMFFWSYIAEANIPHIWQFIAVFLLIALVSFVDDLRTIPIGARFIVHLFCALVALWLYLAPKLLFQQFLPNSLDFIMAAVCLTAFLNVYNFMDGIDGITASQSIHLSITMLLICFWHKETIIHAHLIQVLSTIILGWSLGFLIFNWQPASIFIGDVGSISLGFLLGICSILIAASGQKFFVSSFIMCLYYICDGGLTIVIRLFKREKIWQPHLQHFFQQAVKKGMSHRKVVSHIIFCNIFLMILAVTSLQFCVISFMLALLIVSATLFHFAR